MLTGLHLPDCDSLVFNEMSVPWFHRKVGASTFYIPDIFRFETSNSCFFPVAHELRRARSIQQGMWSGSLWFKFTM